ncbi:MAG TPA: hypothetical protein VJT08_05890 [Terriglobales bacterium]|nr:hypothetical protein [Terriglobales bacterium]
MTAGVIFVLLLVPLTANAGIGDIISLLTSITSTLKNSVGQVLSGIQTINATVRNLQQQVVWPVTLINEARAEVSQVRSQLSSIAGRIHGIQTSSANLVRPKQLEAVLRSHQTSDLSSITSSYSDVYQTLPQAGYATNAQRDLVDSDDAFALSALKTATASDQASEQMLNVADGLEQQAALSAPGSACILTAQAQAANLENQAMLHRLLATELREEAARLAHTNALRKQSADANRNLRLNMQQILTRSR